MMDDLFTSQNAYRPLAERMRPKHIDDYLGQTHLLGDSGPLRKAIEQKILHSMILWGPPGVGKTSFARLLASHFDVNFLSISAVLGGVKEIRSAVENAKGVMAATGRSTILFVDEVHRFNKAQQDAFLPYIEDGTFIFVGATTENPSFELNNALLSRARVYVLNELDDDALAHLIDKALSSADGYAGVDIDFPGALRKALVQSSNGDARTLLNFLELAVDLAEPIGERKVITEDTLVAIMQTSLKRFDKGGDLFYEQISALHKAVRGSDPDASLYWMQRMLQGGCDPLYIARRVVRMASEDIGNADPRALTLAMNAWDALERLGQAEGELSLAQAVVYLAIAPKSNAVYTAYKQSKAFVNADRHRDVPMHLRNAPTKLMKEQGMGLEYRYAHDEPGAFAVGESYFPEELDGTEFYQPVERGLEIKIQERLNQLRDLNHHAASKRYPKE
ncbi:recombination factor protein RarA [Oleiphilus sp. HI0118]|nr:recombination factor protein RarA [Oleiphilus sp. HI0118]KZZ44361.1 recombination factor protein RarA [Oleiphilus sp. HI0118]